MRGRFTEFSGTIHADSAKPETSSVAFTIKAASIDTGNADRDNHLRTPDFFDAAKFPEITFTSTKVQSSGGDSFTVQGDLTIMGTARPASMDITLSGGKASGTMTLKQTDRGINPCSALRAAQELAADPQGKVTAPG